MEQELRLRKPLFGENRYAAAKKNAYLTNERMAQVFDLLGEFEKHYGKDLRKVLKRLSDCEDRSEVAMNAANALGVHIPHIRELRQKHQAHAILIRQLAENLEAHMRAGEAACQPRLAGE
jgi:hypothetical protein